MSDNQAILLTFLGFFTVIGLNIVVWALLRRGRTTMTHRLERSIGLAIPDELRPLVGQRLGRRAAISLTGMIVAGWAVVPFVWSVEGSQMTGMSTNLLLVVGAVFVGGAIGAAIGSVPWPRHRDREAIRYARAGAVQLDDYVAPLERRGAWVAVGLATLVYLASALVTAIGFAPIKLFPPGTLGGLLVVVAIVSLTFFEAVGRLIVRRAQPIGSEPALVWDDALRSADVRGLALAPIALGFYGLLTCGVDFAIGLHPLMNKVVVLVAVNVGGWLAVLAIAAIGIYAIVSRPDRYFLKRLWPQFVDVGAPSTVTADAESSDSAS